MSTAKAKEILIAPLDWGLGHTTRCIPIMGYMKQQGHHISFAGNEWQRAFINNTFRGIDTIHLEGYNIRYGKNPVLSVLEQVPKILQTIKAEHKWLLQQAELRKFDAIISDNRYGLWHPAIPSVIMTHQLQVITRLGNYADKLFQKLHYRYLSRFQQCWVADVEGKVNLSGRLAHPKHLPQNTKYVGLLSQFSNSKQEGQDHLLILLSGPEPQRTQLSKLLWQQVREYQGKVVFVEGTNNVEMQSQIPAHVSWHKQITREALLPLLQNAGMVICRSGYSTLMDLVALNKKAIIIPTPGQTEQEYLATHLHEQGIFYTIKQKDFDLEKSLNAAKDFSFILNFQQNDYSLYTTIVDNWLDDIKSPIT